MSQQRAWCFTLNNPQDEEIHTPFADTSKIRYAIWQLEEAPDTHTPHLQGYVEFKKPTRLAACKKLHATMHWETRQGTREQAINYCKKEDSRYEGPKELVGPHSIGTEAEGGQGTRTDLGAVQQAIDGGASERQIATQHFEPWCKFFRAFERYRRIVGQQRDWPVDVEVFLGRPGTGKSRRAMQENPGAYWKPRGIWWDGYEGQDVAVLDEFFGWLTWDALLKTCDRYPYILETKGGSANCLVRKVVLTTNRWPNRWYGPNYPFEAFARRVTKWVYFLSEEETFEYTSFEVMQQRHADTLPRDLELDPKFD